MTDDLQPRAVLPKDCDPDTHLIFEGYRHLLTEPEKIAYMRILSGRKAQFSNGPLGDKIRRKWVSDDSDAKQLLANGQQAFYQAVRDRILAAERNGKIQLNRCPKCGALTRTPRACLCPSCNHSWYETRQKLSA